MTNSRKKESAEERVVAKIDPKTMQKISHGAFPPPTGELIYDDGRVPTLDSLLLSVLHPSLELAKPT